MERMVETVFGIFSLFLISLSVFSVVSFWIIMGFNLALAAILFAKQREESSDFELLAQLVTIFLLSSSGALLVSMFGLALDLTAVFNGSLFFCLSIFTLKQERSFSEYTASKLLSQFGSVYSYRDSPSRLFKLLSSLAVGNSYSRTCNFYDECYENYDLTLLFCKNRYTSLIDTNTYDFLGTNASVNGDGLCVACREITRNQYKINGIADGNDTYKASVTDLSLCSECYEEAVDAVLQMENVNEKDVVARKI